MNETNTTRLTGKYAKLRDDIIQAMLETADLEQTEDGGTCNFDSPILNLPQWTERKLMRAAEEAGCRLWRWSGSLWVLSFRTSGQGNRRTRRAEAIARKLEELGYHTNVYYQMD